VTPYRSTKLPISKGDPPRELVYTPQNKDGRMSAVRAYVRYGLFVLPGSLILAIVHWWLSVALVVAVVAWDVVNVRRERRGTIRLSIARSKLAIDATAAGGAVREIALWKLSNVSLDTRTANRANREVRADGIIVSGQAFTVEESRIVFDVGGDEPIVLNEKYSSQDDAAGWLGKIRVFLRAHGWLPEDERQQTRNDARTGSVS
jgi:hypothetical protein